MNLLGDNEIPIGLGMALAENTKAMEYFASLSEKQKADVVNYTHQIRSKREMQNYVNDFFGLR